MLFKTNFLIFRFSVILSESNTIMNRFLNLHLASRVDQINQFTITIEDICYIMCNVSKIRMMP